MIMGLDDYKSNIANFTMIFANSKNEVKRIGPFQVGCYKFVYMCYQMVAGYIFTGLWKSRFICKVGERLSFKVQQCC